ncbi:MAG: long-chain fatty acid--CoA ligase [Acidimicrobiia bacterium]|nr:long-chain fatty acid--CoA ligase [Acidimicrobiia bacterium]
MQDRPLLIRDILAHGRHVYGASTVATWEGEKARTATFAEVAARTDRLAAALTRLGVGIGDRVGTFSWNTQEHLEAYLGVPAMGAVLHTLNIRLFPEQLVYVVNHAADKVVIVDDTLVPLLARVIDELETIEHIVVVGMGDASALGREVHRYEDLLAAEEPGFDYPDLDERSAAAMCYTSGTTGNPKGVAYSHRSTYLHALAETSGAVMSLREADKVLPIVPMFHAMAWGIPYAAWIVGADFIMPGRFLQAEPLAKLIDAEKPTMSGAVPTIWNDLLNFGEDHELDLSSLETVVVGGSAVPRSLIEAYKDRYGVTITQAWGMTETSPLGAIAIPPSDTDPAEELDWRTRTGRVVMGVEMRVVADDGSELPRDGEAVGEIEVRGPWVTASYFGDPDPEKFHDGWLRTGDVGWVDARGFFQITDRAKDVIKSGGEWISSVELENTIMGHPDVVEAAVVGIPDDKWQERPLACVVRREGAHLEVEALRDFLESRVAKWWIPDSWAFIDAVPRTSVGKFDKKVLRAQHAAGELDVE